MGRLSRLLAACLATVFLAGACSGDGGGSTTDDNSRTLPDVSGQSDLTLQPDLVTKPDLPPPPTDCQWDGDCDDQNECTTGSCIAGRCVYHAQNGKACDDGDPCTSADQCQTGQCQGAPKNCDDYNGCTEDKCKQGECEYKPLEDPVCKLKIEVTHPPRGTVMWPGETVKVGGKVISPAGKVEKLTINDFPVAVNDGGGFEYTMLAQIGINLVELRAQDIFGRSEKTVRSFMHTKDVIPAADGANAKLIPNSSRLFLRSDVWDDDDTSDFDDLATVAFEVVNHMDVEKFIPSPLFAEGSAPTVGWCTWTVNVSQVDYELKEVDIKPAPGALVLSGSFANLSAHVDAVASWCPDAVGWVYADEINFFGKLPVWVDDGHLYIDADTIDVQIVGVSVDLESGAASLFDWLINWFTDDLAEIVATKLETAIPNELIPQLLALLDTVLEQDMVFHIPPIPGTGEELTVYLETKPVTVDLNNNGSAFGLSVGVGTPKKTGFLSPGSFKRGDCGGKETGTFTMPKSLPIEAAVHEDLINQVLFALWWGGHMNVTVDETLLGDVAGSFGMKNLEVEVEPYLPPIYTTCTEDGAPQMQLGDLYLNATFTMNGQPAQLEIFAAMKVETDINIEPAYPTNKLGINVGDVVAMGIDVVTAQGALQGGEGLMEELLTSIVVDVLIKTYLSEVVASYPIPAIELGVLLPDYFPPNSTVRFQILNAIHDHGFFLVTGKPK